jgi:PEP-CTERM motif
MSVLLPPLRNQLFQYSTSGAFLQSGTPTGLPAPNAYLAGEFAEPVPSVPEPTTSALLGSGLLGLAMMRRRKLGRATLPLA